jgi:hypothetical protein
MEDMRFNNPIGEPEQKPEEKRKWKFDLTGWKVWQKMKKPNIFFAVMILAVLVSVGLAVSFYFKAQNLQSKSQTVTAAEIQKIIAEAGKLIVLPKDEEPTVATVSNVEKLRDQLFFANAKNGDKVLIYTKAMKVILYDPVKKIIVEVAPLNSTAAESPDIKKQ